MPLRYVRIKTKREQVYYGLLQANRSMVVLDAPPWLGGQQTDIELEPESYQILAPCAPSKIVAVGKNYLNHAREMGTPVPQEPLLFLKPPTTIIASDRQIIYPSQSERVDYEGELALVIGDRCRKLTTEQAAVLQPPAWNYKGPVELVSLDFIVYGVPDYICKRKFDNYIPMHLKREI